MFEECLRIRERSVKNEIGNARDREREQRIYRTEDKSENNAENEASLVRLHVAKEPLVHAARRNHRFAE